MRIHLFQQEVKIGSEVEIIYTSGKVVKGRLVEIGEEHVKLRNEKGTATVFISAIGGWEVIDEPGDQVTPITKQPPEIPVEPAKKTEEEAPSDVQKDTIEFPEGEEFPSDETSELTDSPEGIESKLEDSQVSDVEEDTQVKRGEDALSSQVMTRAVAIEVRFRENISQAFLEFLPPDFTFPESEFSSVNQTEAQREWNRIKDMYDYACKIKEFSRLNQQLTLLRGLAKRFPLVSKVHFNIGCFETILERHTEAIEALQTAAVISDQPDYWFNLAVAAHRVDDSPLTCYSLERYFLKCGPQSSPSAWYIFVGLLPEFHNYHSLSTIFEAHIEESASEDLVKLVLETGVYLLKSSERQDRALSVLSEMLDNPPEASHAVALLSSILSDFPQVPTQKYQDVIDKIAALETEIHQTQSSALEKAPGYITRYFPHRGYGYIESRIGETYFFHINNVNDEILKADINNFVSGGKIPVVFDCQEIPGKKYPNAIQLAKVEDPEVIIARAQAEADSGNLPQAIEEIKKIFRFDPENETAHQLNNKWREEIRPAPGRYVGLPKGKGAYARAKRALVDKKLDDAEKLFQEAIRTKDNWESAIKDLASLFQQQNRHEDSIDLLVKHRSQMSDKRSVDNVLATVYQHVGQHDKAIPILEGQLNSVPYHKRPTMLKRIALSQYKSGKYESAELSLQQVLEHIPTDTIAQRWLHALQEAKVSGQYSQADLIISSAGILSEFSADISDFMIFFFDRCKFEGVEANKVASQNFSERDVENLDRLANELGTQRPRERATYYLSAAKILSIISAEDNRRYRAYLRNFCAAMGDAAVAEQKHLDVARAFYCEALLLAPDWVQQLDFKLSQFLLSFLEQRSLLLARVPSVENAVHRVFSDYKNHVRLLENIAIVSVFSREATEKILTPVFSDPKLKKIALDYLISKGVSVEEGAELEDCFTAWNQLRKMLSERYEQMSSEYAYLRQVSVTSDSIEDFLDHLDRLEKEYKTSDLDSQRIASIRRIGKNMLDFSKQKAFEEQERLHSVIVNQCDSLKKDIEDSPTKLSLDCMYPILNHLSYIIEDSFVDTMRTSEPEISMELAVESYIPNRDTEIEVQISVLNEPGCSPASNLKIVFEAQPAYFQMSKLQWELDESLRGDTSKTVPIPMRVTPEAMRELAFPIRVSAHYQTRGGELQETKKQDMTIRLYAADEFEEIDNPYVAETGPVEDPKMFFGRDELLSNLEHAVLSTGSRNKCFVIYGQKRAGKSSILKHLKNRFEFPVIAVDLSIQDIEAELSHTTFLYRILQRMEQVIEDEVYRGWSEIDFSLPSLSEFKDNSIIQFHQIMSNFRKACSRSEYWSESQVVLLIDEFTDIFKEILRENIPESFMKTWKALIENQYFGAVLVGQDVMPKFKARFSNEFGVTQDERITYLAEHYAKQLIEYPIRIGGVEGETRYRGRAVERILELTAGSPFYIQNRS